MSSPVRGEIVRSSGSVLSAALLAERRVAPGMPVPEVEARGASSVAFEARSRVHPHGATTAATCGWSAGFHVSDFDGPVYSSVVYDDGTGPALYVGGYFGAASGVETNGIAKWNGLAWSAVGGPSGTGVSGSAVYALAVYDDGTGPALYAGGSFRRAGGVNAYSIARWDGTRWSALVGPSGNGTFDTVYALAVHDDGSGPALYVGGDFRWAGGVAAEHIARWNGSTWSGLSGPAGNGVSSWVSALAVFDDGTGPALIAGGGFSTAGGAPANNLAKWSGSAWSPLSGVSGNGTNYPVGALAVFDDGSGPALFAGGLFTSAGGVQANHIARWDGVSWSSLSGPAGNGTDASISALTVLDTGSGPVLVAGGIFATAGGEPAERVAQWDGGTWSALSSPTGAGLDDQVSTLSAFDDGGGTSLFVGGWFGTAGGVPANFIARWDGTTWSSLSGPSGLGLNGSVDALAAFDDGGGPALYAAGNFRVLGAFDVSHVARLSGTSWSALAGPAGEGVRDWADALSVFDRGDGPALYVGGFFDMAGGELIQRIARWDGSTWSGLSGGWLNGYVRALAVHDDGSGAALFAGGLFSGVGGAPISQVVRWNGFQWSSLPGLTTTTFGANAEVWALAVFDDGSGPALYAGGNFLTAGGSPASHVARWDGTSWSPLSGPSGNGVDDWVFALAVHRDAKGQALFAGGYFHNAGGVTVNHVARWDGSTWSALTGPSGTGVDAKVFSLASFDDATGSQLVVGGDFLSAGGEKANHIARWDGSDWSPLSGPLGVGVTSSVSSLAAHDDGSGPALYAGGYFNSAGGLGSNHIARWQCRSIFRFADGLESGDLSAWSGQVR